MTHRFPLHVHISTLFIALILLVVMAHGLAWEFMMEPDQSATDGTSPTAT